MLLVHVDALSIVHGPFWLACSRVFQISGQILEINVELLHLMFRLVNLLDLLLLSFAHTVVFLAFIHRRLEHISASLIKHNILTNIGRIPFIQVVGLSDRVLVAHSLLF